MYCYVRLEVGGTAVTYWIMVAFRSLTVMVLDPGPTKILQANLFMLDISSFGFCSALSSEFERIPLELEFIWRLFRAKKTDKRRF